MTYPPQGPYGQQPDPYGQQQPDQYGQYGGGYQQQPTGQYGAYDPNAQYGGAGYPQYGGFGGPPPPQKSKGPVIAVVAIVVILLAGLGITGFVAPGFFLSDDKTDTASGGGGGGGGGGEKDPGPDDFIDKLVAAADDKDKSALKNLTCSDKSSSVDGAIDAIDEITGAELKDTKEESDDEVTVVMTITYDGESDEYAATVVKDGKDWCWQDFAKGSSPTSGADHPTATAEEPEVSDPDTSSEAPGPGGGGDSDGEEFVQSFLDKLNAGDGAGAVGLLCKDSTSQADVTEAAGKSPSLEMDPAGTTADSSYVGADLKGTLSGADASGRTSAFLEDEGWCIYTFYAF